MDLQLKDKVIIVSDGAKGIGAGIVKMLAKEGAIPVIISPNEKDNLKTIEEISAENGRCFHEVAELAKPEACKEVIYKIIDRFGEVHGLINNDSRNDNVGLEYDNYENFIASLHKNLVCCYLLTHYILPSLIKSKGSIVNITLKTVEASQGNASAYAASNNGRNALTREWAVELLKYDIRVNAVVVAASRLQLHEKLINTLSDPQQKLKDVNSKIPLGNSMTTIEEIANTVAFLLSEKSSHTTGQLIHVDGGYIHLDRALANA